MEASMQKSILSALESICSVFYSASRYIVLLVLSIAAVWLSEIYYGTQEVAMSVTLYLIAVGVTASALFDWVFGERK